MLISSCEWCCSYNSLLSSIHLKARRTLTVYNRRSKESSTFPITLLTNVLKSVAVAAAGSRSQRKSTGCGDVSSGGGDCSGYGSGRDCAGSSRGTSNGGRSSNVSVGGSGGSRGNVSGDDSGDSSSDGNSGGGGGCDNSGDGGRGGSGGGGRGSRILGITSRFIKYLREKTEARKTASSSSILVSKAPRLGLR